MLVCGLLEVFLPFTVYGVCVPVNLGDAFVYKERSPGHRRYVPLRGQLLTPVVEDGVPAVP